MKTNTTKEWPAADGMWERIANAPARECAQPAVSVLVSLYNYSAFITGCLDSVRASKTEGLPGGFEVVVVDDGSTDGSARVVEEYLRTYAMPVTLVKKSVNTGLSDTRNLGLLVARAPLVFILDADNEIRPDCLLAHYNAITASGCALAYGHINRFDHATRRSLGVTSNQPWNERELVRKPLLDAMAMFRKEIMMQVGGYSTEYGTILPHGWEDYDLYLKLAQAGHAGTMIPQILSDYRVREGSMLSKVASFQHKLEYYFTRKFQLLAHRHEDLPIWFGVMRVEVPVALGLYNQVLQVSDKQSEHFFYRLLGRKMCRSLRKRLAKVYGWFLP